MGQKFLKFQSHTYANTNSTTLNCFMKYTFEACWIHSLSEARYNIARWSKRFLSRKKHEQRAKKISYQASGKRENYFYDTID